MLIQNKLECLTAQPLKNCFSSLAMILLQNRTGGLCYRTLRTRNIWEMYRFHGKLVTFGLDKQTH